MSDGTVATLSIRRGTDLGRAARVRPTGPWRSAGRRLLQNPAAIVALGAIGLLTLVAIVAPLIAPYGYAETDLGQTWRPPSAAHWLGTDAVGRDILSRLIYGARISLSVAIVAIVIILFVGVPVGAIAGFCGGKVDALLMRLVDAMYAFPDLLFVIAFTAFFEALMTALKGGALGGLTSLDDLAGGMLGLLISLSLTSWLTVARIVRSQVLSLKQREFVEAARSVGASGPRLLLRHLIPNSLPAVIVAATLYVPQAIMLEASISFIGLGVNPPIPSWGVMVSEGLLSVRSSPHLLFAPAAAIALTMLAFNFVGDGLRDALDPTLRS